MNTLNEQVLYLSERRSLYVGRIHGQLVLSGASAQLIVSLGGMISITETEIQAETIAKSFLVPADSKVVIECGNELIAVVVLDYVGVDLTALKSRMSQTDYSDSRSKCFCQLESEQEFIEMARYVFTNKPSARSTFSLVNLYIGSPEYSITIRSDERISKAIDFIRTHSDRTTSIEELARHVCLSVPRLTQLFKQVTGVPIRRMRIWHRIYAVAQYYGEGIGLEEASLKAGFSDYSHFSRSYKEMGGIAPSSMFSARANMKVFTLAIEEGDNSIVSSADILPYKANKLLAG